MTKGCQRQVRLSGMRQSSIAAIGVRGFAIIGAI